MSNKLNDQYNEAVRDGYINCAHCGSKKHNTDKCMINYTKGINTMNKTNLEHYSDCCGAYLHDWPDNPLCAECKEHCNAYLESAVLHAVKCYDGLEKSLREIIRIANHALEQCKEKDK